MLAPKRLSQGVVCFRSESAESRFAPCCVSRMAAVWFGLLALGLAFCSPAGAQTHAYALLQQLGTKMVGTGTTNPAQQGFAAAISADGKTAVVGGPADNDSAGGAWIYTRSAAGVWTQQGSELIGSGAVAPTSEGKSVAISGDGNTVIVGGPDDNGGEGAAWIFTRSAGVWSQQSGKLVGTNGSGTDGQGFSVALSGDGNTAFVGAPNASMSSGDIWVFTRSAGIWGQAARIVPPEDENGNSDLGRSVSVSGDGHTLLIGGPSDNSGVGAAWIYTGSGASWSEVTKLIGTGAGGSSVQGTAVALSRDGSTAVVGGFNDSGGTGALWAYALVSGTWTQQGSKLVATGATSSSFLGVSVAVSGDGSVVLAGGEGLVSDGCEESLTDGAVWEFGETSPGTWTQLGGQLLASDAASMGAFGTAVGLSADGNSALVGADADTSGAGAVWAYDTTISFSGVGLGSNVTQTISIQPENAFTLASIGVVTQGTPNLDFTAAGSQPDGGCAAQTFDGTISCLYSVQFAPTAPGERLGAIVFLDNTGTPQATIYLNGIGLAPQAGFTSSVINTVAGNTTTGFSGDGNLATDAELTLPYGVAVNSSGALYIADQENQRIRVANEQSSSITVDTVTVLPGYIQTVAGDGTAGFSGDTMGATSAELNQPLAPTVDGAGNSAILPG